MSFASGESIDATVSSATQRLSHMVWRFLFKSPYAYKTLGTKTRAADSAHQFSPVCAMCGGSDAVAKTEAYRTAHKDRSHNCCEGKEPGNGSNDSTYGKDVPERSESAT